MDIAHGDLKCENIMLDKNMDVKIGGTCTYMRVKVACISLHFISSSIAKNM